MKNNPLVELDQVSIDIGGKRIIESLSFIVPRGTSTALVGETGSGKSMTCRLMTGLLSNVRAEVTAGRALFDDLDLTALTRADWRKLRGRRIAFIPQNSMSSLNPVRRIGSQLRETLAELDPSCYRRSRAIELLEQVHLPRPEHLLRAYPHELSGGMRQRVVIALALAGNADLLIADEPTTALDVTVQRGIMELIAELRQERGITLILVTHDLELARSVADHIVVMHRGKAVEQGAAQKLLRDPNHAYTKALLAARPSAGKATMLLHNAPGGTR